VNVPGEQGWRCSICGVTWPWTFPRKCYRCGGKTDPCQNRPTITEDEAQSMRNHYNFDRYLEAEGRE